MALQVNYYSRDGPGSAEGLHEGDVLASNHPQLAGGSHLPDITVITPVFDQGKIVFFVASRCPLAPCCQRMQSLRCLAQDHTKELLSLNFDLTLTRHL